VAVQEDTSPSSICLSVRKLKMFMLLCVMFPNVMITFTAGLGRSGKSIALLTTSRSNLLMFSATFLE